ncbi:hypothetical protein KABACHOK_05760 [Brevundimonas phage vB_BpoS-Kabachok]|uniref:Uncharacterized protein n=2 Tax=Marchewkavirus TaxID=3425052 RepID=A0A9E7MQT4_9CAUD|nr:hypothetical protein KABACHOK_05760 [Brevundimonas phage vB_BpoS-Kabachok]USN14523.1 hypothetical protein DOMOVOI_00480 [Brevundimonas phage vB_BpoS-Domovoi]
MQKPVITLKNLKTMPSLSEETTAYTATVYVDGEKFAEASNTGQGGEDRIHPVGRFTYDDLAALEARIKATYPQFDLSEGLGLIDMDLSLLIGEEITAHEWLKAYRRTIKKKVLFTKPGSPGIFQMDLTAPHPLAAHVKVIHEKQPQAVILNLMPEAEGVAYYRAHVEQQ